jgi:hypothetical protein
MLPYFLHHLKSPKVFTGIKLDPWKELTTIFFVRDFQALLLKLVLGQYDGFSVPYVT